MIAELKDVSVKYEDYTLALDHINLRLHAGEHLCILGANGSGKSSLALVLAGLLVPQDGCVRLANKLVFDRGNEDLNAYTEARRSLGYVFQNPDDQIVSNVVEDDVAFGPENLGFSSYSIRQRITEALHKVSLKGYEQEDPNKLSGGQKQRVALAGALAMRPSMLVLDEPAALLDVQGRRAISQLIAHLRQEDTTIVQITHFAEEALLADRVIVLDHGRIAHEGTAEDIFSLDVEVLRKLRIELPAATRMLCDLHARGITLPLTYHTEQLAASLIECYQQLRSAQASPQTLQQKGMLAKHAATGKENTAPTRKTSRPARTIGIPACEVIPTDRTCKADLAIVIEHVSYSYKEVRPEAQAVQALNDINLKIAAGSHVALIGQTGSGKSTLLRLLSTLELPDTGKVYFFGQDTSIKQQRKRARRSVGYCMQMPERQLFEKTVADDIAFGPKNLGLNDLEVTARVEEALTITHLTDKRDASPFNLSGGQQRLCALAGIIAMRPNILLLDEPTAGLDAEAKQEIRRTLKQLKEQNTTLIEVTHTMEDAAEADMVCVLNRSKLALVGSPREIFQPAHKDILEHIGLGLPLSVQLSVALQAQGLPLASVHCTQKALVDDLVALLLPSKTSPTSTQPKTASADEALSITTSPAEALSSHQTPTVGQVS